MVLLPTEKLLGEFEKRANSASQIDIAVAWVGPSRALELLRDVARKQKVRIRVAVGLSGNFTSPEALRSLEEFAEVRIGTSTDGIFHPKFYLFHSSAEAICWIGSANFTLHGFMVNSELVNEFVDDGNARQWFERLWDSLNPDATTEINKYVDAWTRPQRMPIPKRPTSVDTDDPLKLLLDAPPRTWREYMVAVRNCDAFWKSGGVFSVLGPEWSWIETIACGGDLIRRDNWAAFTNEEVNVLIAYRGGEGEWGLLGSMKGAATAVGAFLKNHGDVRGSIRKAIAAVIEAPDEGQFVDAAVNAIDDISKLPRFGPAIATRLITLARPDRGVSVNAGSAPGLAKLTQKLPATPSVLANAKNYPKLLQWVYEQPWYSTPEPQESLERTVWSMRAALIDSFVYKPT
jgi:HKD family nuclease